MMWMKYCTNPLVFFHVKLSAYLFLLFNEISVDVLISGDGNDKDAKYLFWLQLHTSLFNRYMLFGLANF